MNTNRHEWMGPRCLLVLVLIGVHSWWVALGADPRVQGVPTVPRSEVSALPTGSVPQKNSSGNLVSSWIIQNGTNSVIVSNALTKARAVIDLSSATGPFIAVYDTNGASSTLSVSPGGHADWRGSGLTMFWGPAGATYLALTTSSLEPNTPGNGPLNLGAHGSEGPQWNDVILRGEIYGYGGTVGPVDYERWMIDHQGSGGIVFDSQKGGTGTVRDFVFKIDGAEVARIGSGGLSGSGSSFANATWSGITTRNDQADYLVQDLTSATNIVVDWSAPTKKFVALAHNATFDWTNHPTSTSRERDLRIDIQTIGGVTPTWLPIDGQLIIWGSDGSTNQPTLPANSLTQVLIRWTRTNYVGSMDTGPIDESQLPSSFTERVDDLEASVLDLNNSVSANSSSITDHDTRIAALESGNAGATIVTTTTSNNTATPIWTNAIPSGASSEMLVDAIGNGPTNKLAFKGIFYAANVGGTASLLGTNLTTVPSSTNMLIYPTVSGGNMILQVRGFASEDVPWQAIIRTNTWTNGVASGGGGGPSYLLAENFEGAGYEDADWAGEAGTPTPDEDYTGVVVAGSQSLRINGPGALVYNQVTPSGTLSDVYAYGKTRIVALGTTNCTLVGWRTSAGGTTLTRALIDTNGFVKIEANGSTSAVSATQLSAGTTIEWKLRWVTGGTCQLFIVPAGGTFTATDGSGNVYLTRTGSGSFDASRLYLGPPSSVSAGWDLVHDTIRVDDQDIGTTPP